MNGQLNIFFPMACSLPLFKSANRLKNYLLWKIGITLALTTILPSCIGTKISAKIGIASKRTMMNDFIECGNIICLLAPVVFVRALRNCGKLYFLNTVCLVVMNQLDNRYQRYPFANAVFFQGNT